MPREPCTYSATRRRNTVLSYSRAACRVIDDLVKEGMLNDLRRPVHRADSVYTDLKSASRPHPDWIAAWLASQAPLARDPVRWKHILGVFRVMGAVDGLCHDLYKTLAGVRETRACESPREPADDCRLILGVDGRFRTAFRRACLRTPLLEPRRYLEALGRPYGVVPTAAMVQALEARIELEMQLLYTFFEVKAVLERLGAVYPQGLISDSWPFPVDRFLAAQGLVTVLEHRVISSFEGVCKSDGDGTEIYKIAANRMRLPADRLCMIGDDPYRDCLPAMRIGFKVILIDRDYEHVDRLGNWKDPGLAPLGIPVVRSYEHLPAPQPRGHGVAGRAHRPTVSSANASDPGPATLRS